MEDISQEVVKLSKINSASLINLRINNIWLEINKAAVSGNYFRWNSSLDRIWCELVGDIQESKIDAEGKEEVEDIKKFNDLNKDVLTNLKALKIKEGFSQFTKEDKEKIAAIYDSLMKKESFLRALMNKQGKGTAYRDKLEDYINN
jgi:hypothetical protein